MKKILIILPVIAVIFLFFLTYQEKRSAFKNREYLQNMVSNVDTTYQVTVRQMEAIRGYFVKMQPFFEQKIENVGANYDIYSSLIKEIQKKMEEFDKYAQSLEEYCNKIDDYQNNECTSYQENATLLKNNYQTLIEKYNKAIDTYNLYTNSHLEKAEEKV